MIYNNKCDNCENKLTNSHSYSGKIFSWKNNIQQEFLNKKKREVKIDERFQFCDKCDQELRQFRLEKVIKELNQTNIAYSENIDGRIFEGDFNLDDYPKFQAELTKNIKRHSQEWKIKEVNYQPYVQQKPCPPNYQMPLIPEPIRKETILFHQSAKLEYEQNGSLTFENSWDPRKMYFKEDFLPEKWAEIEKQINLREKQANHSKDKTQRAKKENLIILATIILLIVGTIILLIYLTKRKKAKNNN